MISMLIKNLRSVLLTRIFLNGISIATGIIFWSMVTHSHTYRKEISLPLVFDNSTELLVITAPERMHVALQGQRAALHESILTGAVHIDAQQLKVGKQVLHITQRHLLLPTAAKLVDYTPVETSVTPAQP